MNLPIFPVAPTTGLGGIPNEDRLIENLGSNLGTFMGAKKLGETSEEIIDYDRDAIARQNLLSILNENARNLKVHEVAWLLSLSPAQVYETIPRVRETGPVRYCAKTVLALKEGASPEERRSLKIESKKSIAPSRPQNRARKVRACL